MLIKDSGICIRVTDYSETSQVVTFFTRGHGKVSLVAKGSKRSKSSFEGPIELFSQGEVVFSESGRGGLSTLTEFTRGREFGGLARDFFCLNCGLLAIELVREMTDEFDAHGGLYDGLVEFLENVQDCGGKEDCLKFLLVFEVVLLKEVGLLPVLRNCANCRREFSADWGNFYFSSEANGLLCRDCEGAFTRKVRISKRCAEILGDLKKISSAGEKELLDAEKVLLGYFADMLNKPLKMAKYIV